MGRDRIALVKRVAYFLKRMIEVAAMLILAVLLLGAGGQSSDDISERARMFTRDKEFNFIEWTLDALGVKLSQMALGSENYLTADQRKQFVLDYLKLIREIQVNEGRLEEIYADPNVSDPQAASLELRQALANQRQRRTEIAPLAEAILQEQVGDIASDLGLTLGGQPVPPVLYHSTPLPWGLVVSPRDVIRQESFIPLVPDLPLEQQVVLEEKVDSSLDASSLVVGIGGMGLYPTMVDETSSLNWLSEVVAHEWVHNFLMLRPLGISYVNTPELRTMNETTAAIAGKEIGRAVLEKYYPELLPKPPSSSQQQTAPQENQPPPFDFTAEMRHTRVEVDRLLAEGEVAEAEQYMEQRREVFWENGYQIRKLNQAWFAFHGAYADDPGGGAAGEDPVGAAVRSLRAQSDSLAEFVKRISWMSSFAQLQKAVEAGDGG